VIPDLIEQYVDTGKVRYVYREFPLTNIHPAAQKASEAAVCAGEQGRYWEMNETLFATTDEWSQAEDPPEFFKGYAEELGLDANAFAECLDSGQAAAQVLGDLMAGQELGVNATPYFFVDDLPIRGGLPIDMLGQVIDFVAAGGEMPEVIPVGDDYHVFGNGQTATSVAVVFVDYGSAESAKHAREEFPVIEEERIDTGEMIYVVHPWAESADSSGAQAAVAAECAGEQSAYQQMYSLLLDEQDVWIDADDPSSSFADYAASLELDAGEFETCLGSEEAWLRVQAGTILATLNNLPGIPFFVFNNGQGWLSAQTADEFMTILDSNQTP
jgi:protein-disulfide isomerase